jgi:cytochrome c oxidase subunit 2
MKRFTSFLSTCALGLLLSSSATFAASPQILTINSSVTTLFTPSEITVHAGQPVELKLVGDTGVHGIASSQLGIPNTLITPGSTKVVTFTPNKPGTYTLHCTVPCGPDHVNMMLVIKVV